MIDQILSYNKRFVAEKGYEPFITSGQPDMKLAIVSCMDTRLTKLLPNALGLRNGDAKIIKVAGGTILTPYDSVMLVISYLLDCLLVAWNLTSVVLMSSLIRLIRRWKGIIYR